MQCCSIISKKKRQEKNKLIKARAWSPVETIKVMATLLPIHSQPGKIKHPLCDIISILILIIVIIIVSTFDLPSKSILLPGSPPLM